MALSKTMESEKTSDPKTHISYDEFLRLCSNGERLEWVSGRAVKMSAVTFGHDIVRGFLYSIMREYADIKGLGVVTGEAYNTKLGFQLPGRSPDIMFIAQTNTTRILNAHLDGPPDLAVEVLSPGSRRVDKVENTSRRAFGSTGSLTQNVKNRISISVMRMAYVNPKKRMNKAFIIARQ